MEFKKFICKIIGHRRSIIIISEFEHHIICARCDKLFKTSLYPHFKDTSTLLEVKDKDAAGIS
jgi:hypothetical protein